MAEIILTTQDTKGNLNKKISSQDEYISQLQNIKDLKNTETESNLFNEEYFKFLDSFKNNFKNSNNLFSIFISFLYMGILIVILINKEDLSCYLIGSITLFFFIFNFLVSFFNLFKKCKYSSTFATIIAHLLLACNILIITYEEETLQTTKFNFVNMENGLTYALYLLNFCSSYYLVLNLKNKFGLAHALLDLIIILYLFIYKKFYLESTTFLLFDIFIFLFINKEEKIRKSFLADILLKKLEIENLEKNKNIVIKNEINNCDQNYTNEDTEKKLKNLILAKISHEFKAPIMYMQNIIDGLFDKKYEDGVPEIIKTENSENETTQPLRKISNLKFYNYANDINIKSDYLIQLKYLSELVILQILDLCDYANSDNSENLINDHKTISDTSIVNYNSYTEFKCLKEYIVNLTKTMLLIFNKRIKIKCLIHESLMDYKTIIDENKLKRLLANLISNSVKNQYDGDILIKINPISLRDSKAMTTDKPNLQSPKHLGKPESAKTVRQTSNTLDLNYFYPPVVFSDRKKLRPPIKSSDSEKILLKYTNNLETSGPREVNCESSSSLETKNQIIGPNTGFVISIQDSGHGLDEKVLTRLSLFNTHPMYSPKQKYLRAPTLSKFNNILKELDEINLDSNQKDYEISKGCGLGLLLCKKISRELKADLKCETSHFGTTFSIFFRNSVIEKIYSEQNNFSNEDATVLCNKSRHMIVRLSAKNMLKYDPNHISKLDDVELNLVKFQLSDSEGNEKQIKETLEDNSGLSQKGTKIKDSNKKRNLLSANIETNAHSINEFKNSSSNLIIDGSDENFEAPITRNNKSHKPSLFSNNNNKSSDNENPKTSKTQNERNKKLRAQKRISTSKTASLRKNFFINLGTVILNKNENNTILDQSKNESPLNTAKNNSKKYILNVIPSDQEKNNQTNYEKPNKFIDINISESSHSNRESDYYSSSDSDDNNKIEKNNQLVVDLNPPKIEIIDKIPSTNSLTLNSIKVLIVDDNKNNQDAIEKLVHRYYKIKNKKNSNSLKSTTATIQPIIKKLNDGIELVSEIYSEITLNKGKPLCKIIFCDEMMNYMNGSEAFTILSKLFEEKKINKIPFVICSAFSQEAHFEKMKAAKIEHVYQKPLSFGNVGYILDNLIEK
jgi:signal transduction histidine kinase/CheY-like chemotaxis protein